VHDERITSLFAPEWPAGDPSPTRWTRRLEYIGAHSSGVGSWSVSPSVVVACRVSEFDREMRERETQPKPGWMSLPGDAATCVWCGHTSTRGDMTWFDSEDDGRGWACENDSACCARLDALNEAE
jgi:hypothetical protein